MTLKRIIDLIPEVYQNFLPRVFKSYIPEETAATCNDCAMWEGKDTGFPGGVYFSKISKCCTHYPNLPNYLVGGLLCDQTPELETGRSRIRNAIKRRIGITPHGIVRPKKYFLILKNAQKEFFGRSQSLICPFYEREKGRCSIRPFWEAICNTWFCKYSAGEEGRQFWMALKNYLIFIEKTLMHYTLYKMGWKPEQPFLPESLNVPLTLQEVDDQPPDQKSYRELWKDWAGREEIFYKKTYQILIDITPKVFEKITGIYQKILLEEVYTRQKNLFNPQLPKILKRNPKLQVEKKGENSYFLIGYSSFDPFEVSKRVYDLLDFFNGRKPNDEVCRLIKNQTGVRLDKDFLTSLYQFRILVANEKD